MALAGNFACTLIRECRGYSVGPADQSWTKQQPCAGTNSRKTRNSERGLVIAFRYVRVDCESGRPFVQSQTVGIDPGCPIGFVAREG